ncbi:MAG: VOC family protein, partial [Burkholderiales bacterium]|nr:VOC family protein [Burkholderiales bacterium]
MTVSAMNHFTILTDDVPRTVEFYRRLLGLTDGPRPAFGFPGAWLYAGG